MVSFNIIYVRSPLMFPFILYNLVSFATQLLEIPLVRLLESVICNQHYPKNTFSTSGQVEERVCKVAAVQDQLSYVMGWKLCFDALPGLLTAVLFAAIAERYGRRLVLLLCILGNLLMLTWIVAICSIGSTFPVHLVWLSSLFLCLIFATIQLGTTNSLTHLIRYVGIATEGIRSKYFYLLAAGPHINRLINPPIAAILMNVKLLTPFWISMAIMAACWIPVYLIDEPRDKGEHDQFTALPYQHRRGASVDEPHEEAAILRQPTSNSDPTPALLDAAVLTKHKEPLMSSMKQISLLFDSAESKFCLAAFFTKRVAFTSESFVFQYASERFHWPLYQTSWLRMATACGAVFSTMIFWPLMTIILQQSGVATHVVDIKAVRISLGIVSLSFLCARFVDTGFLLSIVMIGCGLGEGVEPALQGFLTFVTISTKNARLFTIIAMADTLAELSDGPLTAYLMAIGRGPKSPSDGICFLMSSLTYRPAADNVWITPHMGIFREEKLTPMSRRAAFHTLASPVARLIHMGLRAGLYNAVKSKRQCVSGESQTTQTWFGLLLFHVFGGLIIEILIDLFL